MFCFCFYFCFLFLFLFSFIYFHLSKISGFTPKEICYPNLGCFSNDYPFYDPPDRPISYIPDSLEMVGTEFFLNTRQNPIWSNAQRLVNTNDSSILNSYFSPDRDTKFICHGYLHVSKASFCLEFHHFKRFTTGKTETEYSSYATAMKFTG